MAGLVLVVVGLGFKIAATPFHMWAPDAYEGAPIPVTAYLAVGSKAAAFALVLRLFTERAAAWRARLAVRGGPAGRADYDRGQSGCAGPGATSSGCWPIRASATWGYLLVGVAALGAVGDDGGVSVQLSHLASNGIILHVVAYGITNMAAFLAVGAVYNATGKERIGDLAGLARRAPHLSLVLTASLFSLAGLPVFAGFVSKFYLFNAARRAGPALARRPSHLHQPHLAILLSERRPSDVHRGRRGHVAHTRSGADDRPARPALSGHGLRRGYTPRP